jgi:hypothetical protein
MKGLHYLRALLQRPGAEITALEMSATAPGHGTAVAEPGAGERLDRKRHGVTAHLTPSG